MAKSIKINFILNAIRTFCSIAFPVFTFAYVSRILDVQGIGMFDYARSIVSYFVLIAQLGISTYGMREIPKVKHDKSKLSNLVAELFCFNVIATVISYILFFGTLMSVGKFDSYRSLLLINSLSIGFCALGLEWMYGALEEYKYITIRTIVFQIISFTLLLLFVREKSDIYIYAAISVLSSAGSNILNFIHAKNYIESPVVKISNMFRHIKPIFLFWGNNITSTLYLLIEITLLGWLCDNLSVGLYSASNKICRIFISLVVAICPILLSRSSSYLANGRIDEYNNLSRQSLGIITLVSVPITVFLFCFSKDIILLFCGDSFLPAVSLSKIMSLLMIIIPVSSFLSMQILIPYGKEGQIFKILFIATLFNTILSLVFIPKYQYTAASIINVSTELLILILYVFISNKIMPILRIFDKLWHYFIAGMLQLICTLCIYNNSSSSISFFNLIFSAVLGIFVYVSVLAVVKNELFLMIVNSITIKNDRCNGK